MAASRPNPSHLAPNIPTSPPHSLSHSSFSPSTRPSTPNLRSPESSSPARRASTPRIVSGPGGGGGARDLLRKHYGLGLASGLASANASASSLPLQESQSQPQAKQDPLDLDSPAFDPHLYYSTLIATASLPSLLARENELVAQIRQLDGERQSLVYNHHHELIAASDTIRAMKTRAESLDASLDTLKAAFSEISRLGAELSTSDRDRNPSQRDNPPPRSS